MSDYHSDKNGHVPMRFIDEWWEYRIRHFKGEVTKVEHNTKLSKWQRDNRVRDAELVRDTAMKLRIWFTDSFEND